MVSDSVQKLDGTIEEDAANVDGSVPKRPHLEEKANGLVHLEIRIIQKGSVGIPASLCGVVGLKTTFGRTDMIGSLWEAGTVPIIGPITATVCSNLGTSPADRIRLNPDMYDKADKLLSSSLNEWGLLLAASDNLNHVWAQTLGDPFLRRLILRKMWEIQFEMVASKTIDLSD
ncbi:uncharacterized protein [Solanum tuberosum]|uniref:uncharacterized protein isoform X1 n=1 Tax=Solanum tuberosum TaxID=4113 RepID=UPI0003D259B5|nr:PREDICTED: uncharacterized protein LOC102601312 isoform X1 [Solanum tuberosum]